ncbi:MAG: hypothetical protein HY751_07880 [Nitrospinae bacterium]|nr:hypothetical protein [Nitrospinota bacterium]
MSVEKLLSALRLEAEIKERSILEEAAVKAEEVAVAAREKSAAIQREIDLKRQLMESRRDALRLARERMARREAMLEAQDAAAQAVKKEARGLFQEFMGSPAYGQYVARELETVRAEAGELEEVRADAVTAEIIRSLGGPEKIAVDENVACGFVASTGGGRRKWLCLLETRLEKLWRARGNEFVNRLTESAGWRLST